MCANGYCGRHVVSSLLQEYVMRPFCVALMLIVFVSASTAEAKSRGRHKCRGHVQSTCGSKFTYSSLTSCGGSSVSVVPVVEAPPEPPKSTGGSAQTPEPPLAPVAAGPPEAPAVPAAPLEGAPVPDAPAAPAAP
jgi:hypothetical protein